jgi:enamine deaminase RidA (YjgF/YER057c/UK114 family)
MGHHGIGHGDVLEGAFPRLERREHGADPVVVVRRRPATSATSARAVERGVGCLRPVCSGVWQVDRVAATDGRCLMARPTYIVPKGVGEHMRDNYHYSQGVLVGDRLQVTGQGGWDEAFVIPEDPGQQIRNSFENIAGVLAEAGSSWNDVVEIVSYHVGDIDDGILGTVVEELRERCPSHQPLWTVLGVARLALPPMKVEISATAILTR